MSLHQCHSKQVPFYAITVERDFVRKMKKAYTNAVCIFVLVYIEQSDTFARVVTDRQTGIWLTATVTLAAHARRGLMLVDERNSL